MSSLNEIVYSQKFLHSDGNSFTFLMKVLQYLVAQWHNDLLDFEEVII